MGIPPHIWLLPLCVGFIPLHSISVVSDSWYNAGHELDVATAHVRLMLQCPLGVPHIVTSTEDIPNVWDIMNIRPGILGTYVEPSIHHIFNAVKQAAASGQVYMDRAAARPLPIASQ